MKLHFIAILVAAVVVLSYAGEFRLPMHKNKLRGRFQLSHSRVLLNYYYHQQRTSLKRHSLSFRHQLQAFKKEALNTDHVAFTLPLKVGGYLYSLSMDTGSSDFFIKGEQAPGVPLQRYKSHTNYKKRKQFTIGYLDGYLNTYEQNLTVQFDEDKFDAPLLIAYTAPPQFETVQGLIGLSFPELAAHRPTFIQTLIQNNIISKYAYGMNLNLIEQNRSFISFGQKDPQLYQGELHEYPIKESSQIKIKFQSIKIGNSKELKISQAILDTGNTCISIPVQYEKQILKAFNTDSNKCAFQPQPNVEMFKIMICKIRNFDELPSLTLTIQGNEYVIEKEFYLRDSTKDPQDEESDAYYCNTYIETVKNRQFSGSNMIFLGDAFFNRFYTFFDLENKKVGIAKNRQKLTIDQILQTLYTDEFNAQDWSQLEQ